MDFQAGGIRLECKKTDDWTVEHNNITDNIGPGLFVRGENNIIRFNNVTNCTDGTETLTACDVATTGGYGIVFHPDGTDSTIHDNEFCDNERTDIYVCDGHSMNVDSDDNTCDSAFDYHDASAVSPFYCVEKCTPGPDLAFDMTTIDISWVDPGVSYEIDYTVCNFGCPGTANASLVGFYVNDVFQSDHTVPELDPGVCYNSVIGPIGFDGVATVRLWADYTNNETRETDEQNNYTVDFGGPDLWIPYFWYEWVDPSQKTYNLVYNVRNTGDVSSPECRVNFTENNGEWSNCIDPVPVPVLGIGETYPSTGYRTMGPFVMGDGADWLEVRVDYDHTIAQNVVGAVQDYNRMNMDYAATGGPCKDCGDVNLDNLVDPLDIILLRQKVHHDATLGCDWSGDVNNCDRFVDPLDIILLRQNVHHDATLDCCKGCDLW